MFQVLQELIVF